MHRQLSNWILSLLLLAPGLAAAAVPATLSFSARIADEGRPVTGTHTLKFTFWDVETGGTVGTNDVWTETQTLDVGDGVVTAVLGADTTTPNPLPISAFNGAGLFFEVSLDGTVFGPRMALHSVPYAFRAGVAEAVVPGSVAPSSLAGTAGTAGQVPVTDGSNSFNWITPAASVHTHAGSDVTSAVANATDAVNATNATNATSAVTASNALDVQCTGCVDDADLATGISGSKISGAVASATTAANATDLQCTGCVGDADLATGISGSKISGAVAQATNAANVPWTGITGNPTLRSGATLRGTFSIEFSATGAGQRGTSAISFPLALATAPTVNLLPQGSPPTANCPGTSGSPQAAPGHLCVYETFGMNIGFRCVAKVGGSYACSAADPWGTTVYVNSATTGQVSTVGSWAVTAP